MLLFLSLTPCRPRMLRPREGGHILLLFQNVPLALAAGTMHKPHRQERRLIWNKIDSQPPPHPTPTHAIPLTTNAQARS